MSEIFESNNDLTTTNSDPSGSENSSDEYVANDNYSGFFEGPEKTMEVRFRNDGGCDDGLRSLTREKLDHLCSLAKCSIMTKTSSNYFDAYVLSESSLFVYKRKYIMKTCGTTTLLRCLSQLLLYSDELNMQVESVVYSRKNLTCPTAQLWPHSSFGDEIKYITNHANLQERLHGNGHILGPVTGDHWLLYVADLAPPTLAYPENPILSVPLVKVFDDSVTVDRTLNLMMFGLASDVCKTFFKRNADTGEELSGKDMTKRSGIADLCPGATVDETAFTPCGYSMNALLHDAYYTVHITPEEVCSYASFETNAHLSNYSPLVRNALKVFRPTRFVITLLGHDTALRTMPELPTDLRRVSICGVGTYVRTSTSSTKLETDQVCAMACFCVEEAAPIPMSLSSRALLSAPSTVRQAQIKRMRGYSMA